MREADALDSETVDQLQAAAEMMANAAQSFENMSIPESPVPDLTRPAIAELRQSLIEAIDKRPAEVFMKLYNGDVVCAHPMKISVGEHTIRLSGKSIVGANLLDDYVFEIGLMVSFSVRAS